MGGGHQSLGEISIQVLYQGTTLEVAEKVWVDESRSLSR
jgi:hypothetical protein